MRGVRDGDGFAYFKDDSVTHGGISGVYGEGLFQNLRSIINFYH